MDNIIQKARELRQAIDESDIFNKYKAAVANKDVMDKVDGIEAEYSKIFEKGENIGVDEEKTASENYFNAMISNFDYFDAEQNYKDLLTQVTRIIGEEPINKAR